MTSENACTTNERLGDGPEQPTSLPHPPRGHEEETDERLLAEDETEDESDEEEASKFLMLMNKAEKKNMKRLAKKKNQFGTKKSDWRNVQMEDPDEETTDTEDDDDNQETKRFLTLMEKAKQKNTKVSIKWVNGQVKLEREQDGMLGQITRREKEKRELEMKMKAKTKPKPVIGEIKTKGKRKFEERMSLNEAKLEDFNDSQDYVNFLQTKLQGVRIKLTK